ncbi:hypothetical protein BH10ACI2_BH10ACI2_24900 [soil metagenome]
MIYKRIFPAALAVFLLFSAANAQKTEVTISLSEGFFDALLESVFKNFDPPQFSVAATEPTRAEPIMFWNLDYSGGPSAEMAIVASEPVCEESVKLLREMNGVRTAVRFRDGKIYVPLAFSGGYAPPFVGCVDFAGWAEANIDLEFEQSNQRLVGRAKVLNVNLNGTAGFGGTIIAKLIQSSIDKKLNPIEIMTLDKVSFGIPIKGSGNLKMKALGVRPEVSNGRLNIHVDYEFLKG